MYLGIDIGGTKTLVAVLSKAGKVVESAKFPTPEKYSNFLLELAHTVHHLEHREFQAAAVAAPGRIDHKRGVVLDLGNLPWHNEQVQADCEKIVKCPVVLENDAKLAGLGEALLHPDAQTALYVTVSTGIGTGVVRDGRLDATLSNMEGGHMLLPFKGKLTKWESFASGKAIYNHFGKKAVDIHDEASWRYVARNLAPGFFQMIAIVQPDLIIIGGSIGSYFDRYGAYLEEELNKLEVPMVPIPRIVQAQRPEEAVIYGCHALIEQTFPHHAASA
ncbi:MAG: ROK family protein [Candidatus Saccharimonadales bacterium]